MQIIEPRYEILTPISDGGLVELQQIERAARTCYKSEDRISSDGESARKLVRALVARGHEAMLEHSQLSVRFICDRGVSHELVRHRICSFAQESTRYCNYGHASEITLIRPLFFEVGTKQYDLWYTSCESAESAYLALLKYGATPQEARSVLPNSLKTEVVVTANYREWRNIFKLRCASAAHPQMRQLMIPLQQELAKAIPEVFDIDYS